MSPESEPHLGINWNWAYRADKWKQGNDFNLRNLAALSFISIIDQQNTPPSSPSDGDRYLVGASPSGDWSGHAREIAVYWNSLDQWDFFTPSAGFVAYFQPHGLFYFHDGSGWLNPSQTIRNTIEHGLNATVSDTGSKLVGVDSLDDGETLDISRATLLQNDGQPVPSGVNLDIVSLDNAGGSTEQAVILSGDGTTVYDDQNGNPLATYQNTTGSAQTVAVRAENTSGSSVDIVTSAKGVSY